VIQVCHPQLPSLSYDTQTKDSFSFIKHLPTEANFAIIYSRESYWWSNTDNYRILSFDGTSWTSWIYSRKWKTSTERFANAWPKKAKYFHMLNRIDNSAVKRLLDTLERMRFWSLSQDSLNDIRDHKVSDDVDYVFRLETQHDQKTISSYAPEYYLNLFPDMEQRKMFLAARNYFDNWWKNNCR